LSGERTFAVQRFPQRDAEAEGVGGRRHRPAEELLGRHVRRGPDHVAARDRHLQAAAAAVGEPLAGPGGEIADPGQPEVGDPHRLLGAARAALDQHVARLEVAVDQAGGVGGGEAAPGGDEQRQHLAPVVAAPRQHLAEGVAVDQLHDQVQIAVVDPDVVDRDHVGMGQPGQRLGLAPQPLLEPAAARRALAQHLDRDRAIELGIDGGVDHAHPAGADPAHDPVAPDGRRRRGLGLGLVGPALVRHHRRRGRRHGLGRLELLVTARAHRGAPRA
jgi:hypothetical protein